MEDNHSPFDMFTFQYLKAKEFGVSWPTYFLHVFVYICDNLKNTDNFEICMNRIYSSNLSNLLVGS